MQQWECQLRVLTHNPLLVGAARSFQANINYLIEHGRLPPTPTPVAPKRTGLLAFVRRLFGRAEAPPRPHAQTAEVLSRRAASANR